jgi:hypothetical protein
MIGRSDERILRRYAKLAGLMYLLTNAAAIFAQQLSGRFIASNDPGATAGNITGSLSLFRLTLALELLTVAGTIALFVALYVVLREVNRNLALLAAFWRLAENCILAGMTFTTFAAVELISGRPYMQAADAEQLQVLMYALLRVHLYGFQVGFLFLGLGSAAFSYLWLKSGYIPRWIAAWGIFASLIMAVVALIVIVYPPFYGMVTMAYMAPMAIYEIGLGLWLLVRGIHIPAAESRTVGL